MPQVDLETLVSACARGGNDRKVACETLASGAGEKTVKDNLDDEEKQPELPPDFPPESFWLSKDAEFDWFDRNAFLDRKQSTKGIGPNTTNLNQGSNSNSNSQRFSSTLKTKASIIGFPNTQKSSYVDSKRRTCKPANIRLFPAKRSESTLKAAASANEPSSPKVSCMGRVRSKRGRRRSSGGKSKKFENKSLERSRSRSKTGFCSRLLSIFRSNKKPVRSSTDKAMGSRVEEPVKPLRKSKSGRIGKPTVFVEPTGLGGMKRFASGRKSESWGGDEIDGVV
ncbi:hypothetical protein RND71_031109 [Anisodus tanguticus]|uniref:Uncharacterized protein n=1 Tax=Anisodus tanguticus TaxID=243964 RepID=A0AAE1V4H5_9SOLA|nr:hypothetical protein RND71_031109 [Anisodus tanguticus]